MSKISPTVPLEQLCDPHRGITYGIVKVGDFIPGGVPVIRGGDIRDGRIVFDDHKRVTEEVSNKFRRTILRGGELLINLIAEPGHVAIVPKNLAGSNVSRDVAVIALNDSVDHRFVCYLLKSPDCVQWLTSRLQGSVTQKINLNTLREVPVPLLPLCQQKAIAHILGTLDDKIELNRDMNQTLEAMAQAIFKSWFVDFDPVRAKMEGRQPAGMDAATAELFPDEFEESALGMIPKGWKISTIGESVKVVGGGTPSTKNLEYWEGGTFNWTTPKDLSSLQSPVLLNTERKITELGLKQISSGLLPKGTVLLSSRAPIGYLVISDIPVAINQGYIAMIGEKKLPNYYILQWTLENMEIIKGRANGTTFLEISKSNFRPIGILIPDSKILEKFVVQVEALYQQIVNNLKQSSTLASIRDTLLPKLLSGEIRIKEAEKIAAKTM